jgi:hypothetical protein
MLAAFQTSKMEYFAYGTLELAALPLAMAKEEMRRERIVKVLAKDRDRNMVDDKVAETSNNG